MDNLPSLLATDSPNGKGILGQRNDMQHGGLNMVGSTAGERV